MNIGEIINNQDLIIGEIAGVEGDTLEAFIYPEKYNKVQVGSLVLVDSAEIKILGLVINKAHSSRYGTFTPLRRSREELERAYPDINRYHKYVSSILYTSVVEEDEIRHIRKGSPRLHDIVYILDNPKYIREYLRPKDRWDLRFINYFFGARVNDLVILETLSNLVTQIDLGEEDAKKLLSEILDRAWVNSKAFAIYLANHFEEILGLR